MPDAVLTFTFSPVQPFIAEARRAADLVGGSYRERYIPMVPPEVKLVADSLVELPPDRAPRALPVP
ncbi:MAG: hypothetical protein C4346_08095, partial [Chloroflexota bacterium]